MVLVEGTSPWVGSSYQRLYIWAEDLVQAMELAKVKISEGFDAAPLREVEVRRASKLLYAGLRN